MFKNTRRYRRISNCEQTAEVKLKDDFSAQHKVAEPRNLSNILKIFDGNFDVELRAMLRRTAWVHAFCFGFDVERLWQATHSASDGRRNSSLVVSDRWRQTETQSSKGI